MRNLPQLLLVGGSQRNVGKTTLLAQLIRKFSSEFLIIGLKVTSIYPGERNYHGTHENLAKDYEIIEEKDLTGLKDTSKMLLAGAKQVFFIRAKDEFIQHAFNSFLNQIPEKCMIVCESISLRKYMKPGLFILIKTPLPGEIKASVREMEIYADHIILTDGEKFDFDLHRICIENNRWITK